MKLDARWNTIGSLKGLAVGLTWFPDPSSVWNSSVTEWWDTSTVVPFKAWVLPKTFFATAKQVRKLNELLNNLREEKKETYHKTYNKLFFLLKIKLIKKWTNWLISDLTNRNAGLSSMWKYVQLQIIHQKNPSICSKIPSRGSKVLVFLRFCTRAQLALSARPPLIFVWLKKNYTCSAC